MKVISVSYQKTIQEKQFEPAVLKIEAGMEDGDNLDAAIQELISTTRKHLGMVGVEEVKTVKETPKKKILEGDPAVEMPTQEKEEPKEKKAAPAKKKAAAPAKKKVEEKPVTVTKYDRLLEPHRAVLGEIIGDIAPNWRKAPELASFRKAVAELSKSLVGHDLYEKEGEVLSSFVNEVVDTLTPLLNDESEDGL